MLFGYDKINLLDGPTPLHYMPEVSKMTGVEIYIKRDDLTAYGMGGNKLRKLQYLVWDAQRQGANMLVTLGSSQTNHGRLTAAIAAKSGLKCAILCVDNVPKELSGNTLLDRILGAEVVIKQNDGSDEDEQFDALKEKMMTIYTERGDKPYFIPVGGSNVIGQLGYYDFAFEFCDQLKEKNLKIDKFISSVGSLGTYMGSWLGFQAAKADFEAVGIAISPFGSKKQQRLMEYYGECCDLMDLEKTATEADFHIEKDYVREGYNIPNQLVRETIYLVAQKEAILLDPCYTGKGFAGMLQMITEGKIKKGETVVFLHTGGTPAIWAPHHRPEFEKDLSNEGLLIFK